MKQESKRLAGLRDIFEKELSDIEGLMTNRNHSARLPHISNFSTESIDGSKLLPSLKKLAVSQGSARSSAIIEPSHVLISMGVADELALSSLRIGSGRSTSKEEIHLAIDEIHKTVKQLRLTVP